MQLSLHKNNIHVINSNYNPENIHLIEIYFMNVLLKHCLKCKLDWLRHFENKFDEIWTKILCAQCSLEYKGSINAFEIQF